MVSASWLISRPAGAAALSAGFHVTLLVTVWIISAQGAEFGIAGEATSRSAMRWRQLEGASKQSVGSNALFDVLAAPDVVRIVLSPVGPDVPTRGLAWWSPSHGLWFAVDAVDKAAIGHTVELWFGIPGQKPIRPGVVYVHPDGSGRMLAIADVASLVPQNGVITLSLTGSHTHLTGRVEAQTLTR
jgi:hypothetical protein